MKFSREKRELRSRQDLLELGPLLENVALQPRPRATLCFCIYSRNHISDQWSHMVCDYSYTLRAVDAKVCPLPMAVVPGLAAGARFKLIFFVPVENVEAVKTAIFSAGAGRYPGPGNYTECAWMTLGTGQFRPGNTASPHIGKPGRPEEVKEYRVETLCIGEDVTKKAVEALKK
nr:gtp cyclohydrolase 1 type 2 like [Quercus suber]